MYWYAICLINLFDIVMVNVIFEWSEMHTYIILQILMNAELTLIVVTRSVATLMGHIGAAA